jgi:hypothetical protein
MPTCTGEARRLILDHLGNRYRRTFGDPWEFVRFAQEQHLDLDLTTPPQRLQPVATTAAKPRKVLAHGTAANGSSCARPEWLDFSVAFTADGKTLASGSSDGTIKPCDSAPGGRPTRREFSPTFAMNVIQPVGADKCQKEFCSRS